METKVIVQNAAIDKMIQLVEKYEGFENGGLLFGRMNPAWTEVHDASDAGENAIRTTTQVTLDSDFLLTYTQHKLEEDLHVIGTWHSHPAFHSIEPSQIDLRTMRRICEIYAPPLLPVFCICKLDASRFIYQFYKIQQNGNINYLLRGMVEKE